MSKQTEILFLLSRESFQHCGPKLNVSANWDNTNTYAECTVQFSNCILVGSSEEFALMDHHKLSRSSETKLIIIISGRKWHIKSALWRNLSKLRTNIKTPPGLRSLQSEDTTDKNAGMLNLTIYWCTWGCKWCFNGGQSIKNLSTSRTIWAALRGASTPHWKQQDRDVEVVPK